MVVNKKTEPDLHPFFEAFGNAQEYCYSCGNARQARTATISIDANGGKREGGHTKTQR